MEQQLVIFELADEQYGLDIASVESIIKIQGITAVPQAPAFVEGVTNLRGVVLPVIDLRKRFGLANIDKSKETRIVVVEMGDTTVGMVVDAVTEVLRISSDSIEPPSPLVTTVDSTFITGIAKVEERLIIMLDLGKVLSVQEQGQLQAVKEAV